MQSVKNYTKPGGSVTVIGGKLVPATEVQPSHLTALKIDYTTGDLDAESEVIAALNATNARNNAIMTALEGVGVFAAS